MPRTSRIDESKLSKGERRKLNALRKSVGDSIAERAFRRWQATRPAGTGELPKDPTAEAIAATVMELLRRRRIGSLPRAGLRLKRGRGRVIVTRMD